MQLEKFLRTPLDGRLSFIGTVFKKCLYMQHETVRMGFYFVFWDFYTLQIELFFYTDHLSLSGPNFIFVLLHFRNP